MGGFDKELLILLGLGMQNELTSLIADTKCKQSQIKEYKTRQRQRPIYIAIDTIGI